MADKRLADKRRRRSDRGGRRLWILVGLGAFLVLDIVLVSMALTRDNGGVAQPAAPTVPELVEGTDSPTTVPGPTTVPDPTTVPEPVEGTDSPTTTDPATRFISALDDDSAWRTQAGECPSSAAILERTSDGGSTWEQFPIAPAVEVSSIQRLQAADDAYIYMVGQRPADCSLIWAATFTGGADWGEFEAQLGDTWFVDATNRARVHAPGGDHAAPCDAVVGLAVTSATEAAALCSTQTIFRTADGAETWDEGVPMPGAVSLDNSDDGYVVATIGQPDCAGVQVRNIGVNASDADVAPALGCLALDGTPDETSVSYASGSVWLWADDVVRASTDGGVTW